MIFLYHANCTDGAGAALAAWMMNGDYGNRYIPVQYGQKPPKGLYGEHIFMLDFSYKRPVIKELAKKAATITIIDHHKTAEDDLAEPVIADNVKVVFDMNKSGAVLTWEYYAFWDNNPVPKLLLHIQDRDLWQFKMKNTADIIKGLRLIDDWRDWSQFIEDEQGIDKLAESGANINKFLRQQSEGILRSHSIGFDLTGDAVPVYNLPGFMMSDTLHLALERYPDAPYAVGFIVLNGKTIYSLRSRSGSDIDVSAIAVKYGGGGHKHAAGFSVEKN